MKKYNRTTNDREAQMEYAAVYIDSCNALARMRSNYMSNKWTSNRQLVREKHLAYLTELYALLDVRDTAKTKFFDSI